MGYGKSSKPNLDAMFNIKLLRLYKLPRLTVARVHVFQDSNAKNDGWDWVVTTIIVPFGLNGMRPDHSWLVVWLPFFYFLLGISNHPNWRTHIFQRGWNHAHQAAIEWHGVPKFTIHVQFWGFNLQEKNCMFHDLQTLEKRAARSIKVQRTSWIGRNVFRDTSSSCPMREMFRLCQFVGYESLNIIRYYQSRPPITSFILGRSGTFWKQIWNALKRFASVWMSLFLADSIHQHTRHPTGLQEILQSGEEFRCNWPKTVGSKLSQNYEPRLNPCHFTLPYASHTHFFTKIRQPRHAECWVNTLAHRHLDWTHLHSLIQLLQLARESPQFQAWSSEVSNYLVHIH